MKHKSFLVCLLLCALAVAPAFALTTITNTTDLSITLSTVRNGDATDNSSAANPNAGGGEGYNLLCSDGVTVTLNPPASPGSGYNRFYSTIWCTGGKVTLDVSPLAGAPLLVLGNLHFNYKNTAPATLHIKGTNTVYFGNDGNWPSYYPTFNVPNLEFDDGVEDGKIVFLGQCCLHDKPADLRYEILPGANIAVHNNLLGLSGDYTLGDFDITIFDSSSTGGSTFPANTTITVPAGRTLNIFPCSVNANLRWARTGGTISNNVMLDGGTLAFHTSSKSVTLSGSLSGSGTIKTDWKLTDWNDVSATVAGPVALTNTSVSLQGRDPVIDNRTTTNGLCLVLQNVQPGTSFSSVALHRSAANAVREKSGLSLSKAVGAEYRGSPVTIAGLTGGRICDNTSVNSDMPLVVSSVSGAVRFANASLVTLDAIDVASEVSVSNIVGSVIPPDFYHTKASASGDAKLHRFVDGDVLDVSSVSTVWGTDAVATNRISVVGADPKYRITSAEGGDVTVYQSSTTPMQVVAKGGRINLRRAFSDWRAIPTLWLDASAANTISNLYIEARTRLRNEETELAAQWVYFTMGGKEFPLVRYWLDCREDMRRYKGWSDRYDFPHTSHNCISLWPYTHPYVVAGGLNGKDYISFGVNGATVSSTVATTGGENVTVSSSSFHRMLLYNQTDTTANGYPQYTPSPRYAFLVFGSQNGGGWALLGGHRTNYLERASKDLSAAIAPNADIDIWIDGTNVAPTAQNALNGGWQVITLGLAGKVKVSILGCNFFESGNTGMKAGGQNYAEVIFVDQELSEKQRQTIEMALAEKWGLEEQYNYPAWTQEAVSSVYGSSGTVRLETDARITGAFGGTIELNGHDLEIVGDALPPDESAISTANMVGWYDPDAPGKTKEGNTNAGTGIPRDPQYRLRTVWNKLKSLFTVNDLALNGTNERAPFIDESSHGAGPVRRWMDFANLTLPSVASGWNSSSYDLGNTLRFSKITSASTGETDGSNNTQPMRTIMMVQDSVRGGGMPFVDNSLTSPTLYKRRDGDNAKPGKPIYPSGTSNILTGGKTYLDGEEVDGTVASFGGHPEVFTVIPTETVNVAAIGQLYNSLKCSVADGNTAAEIIGEIMMWDCALDDTRRKTAEAYLAWKWLGTTAEGYSALTNATVTGSGSVKVANTAVMPKFAAGCTADVTLDNGDMAFTLDGDVLSGARDFGGATLNLPASCAITVALPRKPVLGDYVLISSGGIAAGTSFTFTTTGYGAAKTKFKVEEDRVVLNVVPRGIKIDFK